VVDDSRWYASARFQTPSCNSDSKLACGCDMMNFEKKMMCVGGFEVGTCLWLCVWFRNMFFLVLWLLLEFCC